MFLFHIPSVNYNTMQITFYLVGDSQEFLLFLQEALRKGFGKIKIIKNGRAFVLNKWLGNGIFHF